jgi:hypothetical protein
MAARTPRGPGLVRLRVETDRNRSLSERGGATALAPGGGGRGLPGRPPGGRGTPRTTVPRNGRRAEGRVERAASPRRGGSPRPRRSRPRSPGESTGELHGGRAGGRRGADRGRRRRRPRTEVPRIPTMRVRRGASGRVRAGRGRTGTRARGRPACRTLPAGTNGAGRRTGPNRGRGRGRRPPGPRGRAATPRPRRLPVRVSPRSRGDPSGSRRYEPRLFDLRSGERTRWT